MESSKIRECFFQFFQEKGHKIVPSAPIVNKNDPSLMFTNAGMNQFKDYFLGYAEPEHRRLADTQKCLRVSGKHNDLEEVGVDGYHHTMFEMLGNWSVGDYFKEEAIAWAWELLTERYGLDKERMYVTVFEGDASDGLGLDEEARSIWARYLPAERILNFGKKDNFWEMGEAGPCGPCSEIHYDLRPEAERVARPGAELVNADHPGVIEIWNLVFIQYNRKADGSLESLPARHIDTGMGFERLAQVLQGKRSNYDTDIFQPLINYISQVSGHSYRSGYGPEDRVDMAMRVIADHIRAVAFTIADGEIPGNTGAGYVIRRILRRAVRYYYSFLGIEEPVMYGLVPVLARQFADVFPELAAQEEFVSRVVREEERSFLRTLEGGLKRLESYEPEGGVLDGDTAFELYDTYGFPIDLTRLIVRERGWQLDERGFDEQLRRQKERSRADAVKKVGDWDVLVPGAASRFVGYDRLEHSGSRVLRTRRVEAKGQQQYQLVLDTTPFYPEGGGQVGDTGTLQFGSETIRVLDTIKEHDLVIHIVDRLPSDTEAYAQARVDRRRREWTESNHSATHLLHAALRQVLGDHVAQKGSLVTDGYLRFDFSHFGKMTEDELAEVERIVNGKIRENVPRREARDLPLEEARAAGAMMLFGEKYGDRVRMITFDPEFSVELCGGCHVEATGEIGFFKILSESAVAAGVRRVEAVTGPAAERFVNDELAVLAELRRALKNARDPVAQVEQLQESLKEMNRKIEAMSGARAQHMKAELLGAAREFEGVNLLVRRVSLDDARAVKDLVYQLESELRPAVVILGFVSNDKPQLMVRISEDRAKGALHAGQIVRQAAARMQGGGGGQPFFASAGGKDVDGLDAALELAGQIVRDALAGA